MPDSLSYKFIPKNFGTFSDLTKRKKPDTVRKRSFPVKPDATDAITGALHVQRSCQAPDLGASPTALNERTSKTPQVQRKQKPVERPYREEPQRKTVP